MDYENTQISEKEKPLLITALVDLTLIRAHIDEFKAIFDGYMTPCNKERAAKRKELGRLLNLQEETEIVGKYRIPGWKESEKRLDEIFNSLTHEQYTKIINDVNRCIEDGTANADTVWYCGNWLIHESFSNPSMQRKSIFECQKTIHATELFKLNKFDYCIFYPDPASYLQALDDLEERDRQNNEW